MCKISSIVKLAAPCTLQRSSKLLYVLHRELQSAQFQQSRFAGDTTLVAETYIAIMRAQMFSVFALIAIALLTSSDASVVDQTTKIVANGQDENAQVLCLILRPSFLTLCSLTVDDTRTTPCKSTLSHDLKCCLKIVRGSKISSRSL